MGMEPAASGCQVRLRSDPGDRLVDQLAVCSGIMLFSDQSAGPNHPHHQADHSHDNPNTLPIMWSSTAMLHRSWQLQVLPWIEMVQASRLERPPMG